MELQPGQILKTSGNGKRARPDPAAPVEPVGDAVAAVAPDSGGKTLSFVDAAEFALSLIRDGLGDLAIVDQLRRECSLKPAAARRALDRAYAILSECHGSRPRAELLAKAVEQRESLLARALAAGDQKLELSVLESREKLLLGAASEAPESVDSLARLAELARLGGNLTDAAGQTAE